MNEWAINPRRNAAVFREYCVGSVDIKTTSYSSPAKKASRFQILGFMRLIELTNLT